MTLMGATSCGSSAPTAEDFSERMVTISEGAVSPELANCLFLRLEDEPELMDRAMTLPELPKSDDEDLQVLLAECIIEKDQIDLSEELQRPEVNEIEEDT